MSEVEKLSSALFVIKSDWIWDFVVLEKLWLFRGLDDVGEVGVQSFRYLSVFF